MRFCPANFSPRARCAAWLSALWLVTAAAILISGCGREPAPATPRTVAEAVQQTSASCRDCHAEQFAAWRETDHALANRPIDLRRDADALAALQNLDPAVRAEFILGHLPLWQPLIARPGGRWQPHELAYDPARGEWFNVFGAEARREGEWGHWTGRGMNWNSMCAQCHMTGYQKGYDAATDRYHSTWVEHGIGCIQCHGPTAPDHGRKNARSAIASPTWQQDRARMMQTCAPCHARNEALTDRFQPGDAYHDHYRVVLPTDAATFYPDGQQRDEVFNWTSMITSRMGHAGVTCMDCHDPHTTKTILPTANNQLCLQCHAAPGRKLPSGVVATVIDPLKHSAHAPGSAGDSCLACHMPTTTYMQRAARHDHGWLSPDPRLTKELGIPNACSRCHEEQGIDWNIAQSEVLFDTKVRERQRVRARAIAAAQAGAADAVERLLAAAKAEDIPAWRATYLLLLAEQGSPAAARDWALRALQAADPIERAAAARFFAGTSEASAVLTPLLQDPVRLVRLEAAWPLSAELPADSAARRELDAYLALTLDQPAGRLRLGQDRANRGDLPAAEREMARAVEWDPHSPVIREARGLVLAGLGRPAEAGTELYRAAELAGARGGPGAFRAGLAFAEAGKMIEAENAFRLAVRREPEFARAWYNLGLLLAQQNRLEDAADALRRAEQAAPAEAEFPYALATVLLRAGDRDGARAAAQRTVKLNPAHPGAREIMRRLPGR